MNNTNTLNYRITNNVDWGFYGTCVGLAGINFADKAWDIAFECVKENTNYDDKSVQEFLDSRFGRHYADTLSFCDDINDINQVKEQLLNKLNSMIKWHKEQLNF